MSAQPSFLQGRGRGRGKSTISASDVDSNTINSANERFLLSAQQNQQSLAKHINQMADYESSSEEEDDVKQDEKTVLSSVIKSWSVRNDGDMTANKQIDSEVDNLGATHDYLVSSMKSKGQSCIICIETIRKHEAIWSCMGCGCMFHITCIQKWIKDGIYQRIKNDDDNTRQDQVPWHCPKCRHTYSQKEAPSRYYCFCGKQEDPEFDPWLLPHSCGQMCEKPLKPECGHRCLLLCHPGLCPPCPKTIRSSCHCGGTSDVVKRCSERFWSCGRSCGKPLPCGQHRCQAKCHTGECPTCPEVSIQYCVCGAEKQERVCAEPVWQCDKICNLPYTCGHHNCETRCHSGECGDCPSQGNRACPCGKTTFDLPCTETPPTCIGECGKLLACGKHHCEDKCHKGNCPTCAKTSVKKCRCGEKEKSVICGRAYVCDSKCTRWKDCMRHKCKRKCCLGDCGSCDLPCNKKLTCGNHSCNSVCHRGPCYPCRETVVLACACGSTKLRVPCGREKIVKPPRCQKICNNPPTCHHPHQRQHRCHFGPCPKCELPCEMKLKGCDHLCPAPCHTNDTITIKHKAQVKRAGPWEPVPEGKVEVKKKECPPCRVPVPVECLGGHEVTMQLCSEQRSESCHSPCGQPLSCGNHVCQRPCHLTVEQDRQKGVACEVCEKPCSFPRRKNCTHECMQVCHPGKCKPCMRYLKQKCHCGLMDQYIECDKWSSATESYRQQLRSCPGICTKELSCGHKCNLQCHPPPCHDSDECVEKVPVLCQCGNHSAPYPCPQVQSGEVFVACVDRCGEIKRQQLEAEEEEKRKKEDERKQKEQKSLLRKQEQQNKKGKKKKAQRQYYVDRRSFYQRHYKPIMCAIIVALLAVIAYFIVNT